MSYELKFLVRFCVPNLKFVIFGRKQELKEFLKIDLDADAVYQKNLKGKAYSIVGSRRFETLPMMSRKATAIEQN